MLKAVIFDLDGTLLDTEGFQWLGWIEVLKPFGIDITKKEYFDYAGKTGNIIEKELVKKYNLKIKEGYLLEQKERLLMQWFKTKKISFMNFAEEAIDFFLNNNLRLGIVSGGPKDEILLKLKRVGIRDKFSIITSAQEVSKGKPHPDIYLLAIKKFNLKPEECIVFEDTQYGVESAIDAGIPCIAVPNEFSVKQDFSRATIRVKNLEEGVNWVKENLLK